jgi:hypothetical protein
MAAQKRIVLRKRHTTSDKSRYYIDKEEYNNEVVKYVTEGRASERLGELFTLHVDKYGSMACFKGYTYLDEMKSQARFFLLKYSRKFDPNYAAKNGKKKNAFSYCTTIIHNAFLQIIIREKKHSVLKDKLIKDQDKINYELERFSVLNQISIDE